MMIKTIVVSLILLTFNGVSQGLEAYRIYSSSGEQVDFKDMVADLLQREVVLFGESHNNPIDHWMQLEFLKAIEDTKSMTIGAEMFESDDQVVLNEYLHGKIKLDHLKKEAKIWPNYDTDYAPLVEYAKLKDAAFIATNVPRRYASLVSREGIEGLNSLSKDAKTFMPKLPFQVTEGDKGYAKMRDMMGGHGHGMDISKLIAAQALKDYTMAHNISKNIPKDGIFIHFNGTFHSNDYSGIYNYLIAMNKKLSIGTIASVESDSMQWNEEWKGLADYIIVKPESMTKTH